MFAVGRYDPRAEDAKASAAAAAAASIKKEKKQKRKKKKRREEKKKIHKKEQEDSKNDDDIIESKTRIGDESPSPKNNKRRQKLSGVDNLPTETTTTTKSTKRQKHSPKKEEISAAIEKDDELKEESVDSEASDGDDTNTSSSVPSSSSSSSSEEEEERYTSKNKEKEKSTATTPALRVIAPEQKIPKQQQRTAAADEGIDDFDDFDENLVDNLVKERSVDKTSSSSSSSLSHDDEVKRALKYSSLPINEVAHKKWNLAPFLCANLQKDGFRNFFPIQCLVIPDVIASERNSHIRPRDVCVSAPTGSGKTLGFVLPVLNSLSTRVVRRLRALVVLPGRDLASQVYDVFERYTKGSDLCVGLAIGQKDFITEQKSLVLGGGYGETTTTVVGSSSCPSLNDHDAARIRYALDPTNAHAALDLFDSCGAHNITAETIGAKEKGGIRGGRHSLPRAGRSAVDVLVATPGRLMDHIEKTPGFTLQHLRFLVIDEADRLVNQSYQNWIGRVMRAASAASAFDHSGGGDGYEGGISAVTTLETTADKNSFVLDPITWRKGGMDGTSFDTNATNTAAYVPAAVCQTVPLRKLLFSATLTKDPQKLASLGLVNPKHFDAHRLNVRPSNNTDDNIEGQQSMQQRYSVPEHLSEFMVECTAQQKPLVLLALLLEQIQKNLLLHQQQSPNIENTKPNGIIVVFTSSLDSTHRLTRLLQILWGAAGYGPTSSIAEFSSALTQKQRTRLVRRCTVDIEGTKTAPTRSRKKNKRQQEEVHDKQHPVSVVVCSDGMSRGMDIPSVSVVINYDVPHFAKTYVHRCGRTARAGRKGKAISVLKGGQVGKFLKMRQLIDHPDRVQEMGVRKDLVRGVIPLYQSCMRGLRSVMEAEKDGELDTITPLTQHWLPSNNTSNVLKSKRNLLVDKSMQDDKIISASSVDELSSEDESCESEK